MIGKQLSTELHDQLLADRERIQGEIRQLDKSGIRGDVFLANQTDAADQQAAEASAELHEREKNLTVRSTLEVTLQRIDDALKKFDAGTYGVCESCGNPIPEARLRALPYAIYDVDCQTKLERKG